MPWRFEVTIVALSELESDSRTQNPGDLPHLPIRAGDTLLLEGSEDNIARACEMLGLLAVGEPLQRRASRDSLIALVIFALVVIAAVFKLVPISVAAACGVLATVAVGLMRWEDVESAVEWRIVLIVASSIALGDALVRSGTMDLVAGAITGWAGQWPKPLLLALLITITGLLTNFVSNNAAAAIMTPLSLALAQNLSAPLEPFVLGVLFGANLCFLTPFAYQTNLLVMAAAGYRFNDFIKVGLPLFVLMVPALTATLAMVYF
ncbi:MAG: SLC13 family permease [Burkholderiaceae bacterium]